MNMKATRLKSICSWCGVTIREGALPVSHGICPDCIAEQFPAEDATSDECTNSPACAATGCENCERSFGPQGDRR